MVPAVFSVLRLQKKVEKVVYIYIYKRKWSIIDLLRKIYTKPSSANHFQDNDEVKTNRLAG